MVVEVPLFPTTHSPVLTYLPYLEFWLYGGEHHSHNFLDGGPDSRSHTRASTPFYYNDRLSGFRIGRWGSRIGICFKSDAKSWNTSGCRRIRSDHGFSYTVLCPNPGTTNSSLMYPPGSPYWSFKESYLTWFLPSYLLLLLAD